MNHPKLTMRWHSATRFETRKCAATYLDQLDRNTNWTQLWPNRQAVKRGEDDYVVQMRDGGPYVEVKQ